MVTQTIKIDIWSDIACPWCYIGKRKFETALGEFEKTDSAVPVELEYHSFELHPDTPVDFVGNEYDFLTRNKGMPGDQIAARLVQAAGIAAAAGLVYDYDRLPHINSIKAHQLVHYAKARGMQVIALNRVLRGYFQEGRHPGRIEDLADLGADLGFDRDDVIRSLAADEYLEEVRADLQRAEDLGIRGVPYFVINDRYAVSGAHEASSFLNMLQQVAAENVEAGE